MSGSNFRRYVLNAVLAGAVGRASTMLKDELERAKNEVQSKLKAVGIGAALVAVAAGLMSVAAIFFLIAGFVALTYVWPAWLVGLVIGGVALLIGLILLAVGMGKIKKNKDLVPEHAIENIKKIFNK